MMEDRPVVRPSTTHHNTEVRCTSVPREEDKPLFSVLEQGKAVQVIGLLHTEPPYCVLQLFWTLFSAFFAFRFSTNGKNDDGRLQ